MDRPMITEELGTIRGRQAPLARESAWIGDLHRPGSGGIWHWRHVETDPRFLRRELFRSGIATVVFIVLLGIAAVAVVRLGGGPVNPEAGFSDPVAPVSDGSLSRRL
jgi:hypothetical protein